jgi:uncharacterized protein (TIGR00369 family)
MTIDIGIPEGFVPTERSSPFLRHVGQVFQRRADGYDVFGLRVDAHHLNGRGTAHGGVLTTLCDVALGYATAFSHAPPLALTTVQLSTEFYGAVREGEWLEASVAIERIGKRLAFASCVLTTSGNRVGGARAIFARQDDKPISPSIRQM